MITSIEQLRVFTGPEGRHGNILAVVRDGAAVPDVASRQALARELGLSETVFVDDPRAGAVDIYTPGVRLPFAGYPLIGAAWLLGLEPSPSPSATSPPVTTRVSPGSPREPSGRPSGHCYCTRLPTT